MTVGIYKITNNVTGRVYIGKSVRVRERLWSHKSGMKTGHYEGRTSRELAEDARIYGIDSFSFEIIQTFGPENWQEMAGREIEYMVQFESMNPEKGYNRATSEVSHVPNFEKRVRKTNTMFEIHQLSNEGVLLKVWDSMSDLLENSQLSLTKQGVHRAASDLKQDGKPRIYRGFQWKKVRK